MRFPLAGPNYSLCSAAKLVMEGLNPCGHSGNRSNRGRPAPARPYDLDLLLEAPGQDEDLRLCCVEFPQQDVNVKRRIRNQLDRVFGGCRLHNSPGYVGGECASSGVYDTDPAQSRCLSFRRRGRSRR